MPFEIIRGDITELKVDAIVNAANPEPIVGWGVDAGIHQKAGPKLLTARRRIGAIRVGQAAVTPGYDLPAKYVIHAVGPVWVDGHHGEADQLRAAYDSALALAAEKGCLSVAFPLLSSGNYGFPKDVALQTAISAFSAFLTGHDVDIILAVFDRAAFELSGRLFALVRSYIDEHYIETKLAEEYGLSDNSAPAEAPNGLTRGRLERERRTRSRPNEVHSEMLPPPIVGASPAAAAGGPRQQANAEARPSLREMLSRTDAGFADTLLKLIDRTGKKDPDIYKKANIDRKLFSKIKNVPGYKPSKATALALAIALELDLDETKDFIGRAGYALTHSSEFDIIIEFFIVSKNYDIFEINETLFAFDQPLLGGNVA